MENVTVGKREMEVIANVLRITANIYGCRNKKGKIIKDANGNNFSEETAWDREVVRAEKYANEILKKFE